MPTKRAPVTRQTFNVVVGWVGVALGIVLLVTGLAGGASPTVALLGVVLAVIAYCVIARPFIRFTIDDVVVSNVVREVTIPWPGVSHATSRGSLAIHDTAEQRTTVWAIGAQKPRSESRADADIPTSPLQWRADPTTLVAGTTSAAALREAINAETIDNPPTAESGRRVRWLPVPCVLLLIACASLITAVLV